MGPNDESARDAIGHDEDLTGEDDLLRQFAPGFYADYLRIFSRSLRDEPQDQDAAELPAKYLELMIAVVFTSLHAPQETVVSHLRRALDVGLTPQEAVQGYVAAQNPAGFLMLQEGLRAVRAALSMPPEGAGPAPAP